MNLAPETEHNLPDVTTGVVSSIAPIYRSMPYSSSANPCNKILIMKEILFEIEKRKLRKKETRYLISEFWVLVSIVLYCYGG